MFLCILLEGGVGQATEAQPRSPLVHPAVVPHKLAGWHGRIDIDGRPGAVGRLLLNGVQGGVQPLFQVRHFKHPTDQAECNALS